MVQATLCKVETQLPSPKMGRSPSPIFGPFQLWRNGWMHQDATWYGGSWASAQGTLCYTGTQTSLAKRGWSPLIFGPCLSRSNGCMDQNATWYGGRPRPRRHCVRWGPSYPAHKGGAAPSPICTEVGLGPGHTVLGGDPAPLPKKCGIAHQFSTHLSWTNG